MPSAPSPLQGAAAAPNSIPTFYKSIYTSARTILGDDNPLPKANQAKAEFIGAVCAYVWGLPIQQFWETQGRYINNAVSGGSEINTFFTASNINVSDTVVSPNTQVLYANAFIDLSNKILKVNYPTPDSGTYTLVQVIDPYTNVQYSNGSARSQALDQETSSQIFYWAGADENIRKEAGQYDNAIAIANPQAWILGRVEVDPYQNPSQEAASTPYQTANPNPSLSLEASARVNNLFSIDTIYADEQAEGIPTSSVTEQADSAETYFTQLSNAVYSNSTYVYHSGITNGELNPTGTLYDQSEIFANFGSGPYSIGLKAAADDSGFQSLSESIQNGYETAKGLIQKISVSSGASARTNQWNINTSLGQYQPGYQVTTENWLVAAAVASVGLGANISSDGTYPQTNFDANGNLSENRLDGSNDYRLSFESTSLPPVDTPGSWSITIYDDNNNIVSNSSNSYYINPTEEGSTAISNVYSLGSDQFPNLDNTNRQLFSLKLSATAPTNTTSDQFRIPTPASGNFNVVMRLYNPVPASSQPRASILSSRNAWIPPGVEKLSTTTNGPLQHSKIHLDTDNDLVRSKNEASLKSDQNGQYPWNQLKGNGTLVLKGGQDQLTGESKRGRLLADGKSEVISPMTTVDWGLKQAGFNPKQRDSTLDQLISSIYTKITGQKITRVEQELHQATTIAPHQAARSNNQLAISMAISNSYLGDIIEAKWKKSQRKNTDKESSLAQFSDEIITFSSRLAKKLDRYPFKPFETILKKAAQPNGHRPLANRLDLSEDTASMDYHDFIATIAMQQTI